MNTQIDLNKLLDKNIVVKVNYEELGILTKFLDEMNFKCGSNSTDDWKDYRSATWYASTMETNGKCNKSFGNGIKPFMILDIYTGLNIGSKSCYSREQKDVTLNYYPKQYKKEVVEFTLLFKDNESDTLEKV